VGTDGGNCDPSRAAQRRASPYLLLVLTTFFWAGNFVLGRAVHELIPPIALSFWRWSAALMLVLPFAWPQLRRDWSGLRRHWVILSVLGVLGVTNFNTFVYLGLQTTTATSAVLLVSTTPVLIVALSFAMLGVRVTVAQMTGILTSLAGVLVIVAQGDPATLLELEPNRGDLWVLAAVVSWALYSVCLRWRPQGLHPLSFLVATFVLGLLPLLPLYLWELRVRGGFAIELPNLAAIGYVALFPSVLAYIFWNRAVASLGANRSGQFLHLMPAFGVALSVLLLGERPQGFHLLGIVLIGGGIALTTRSKPMADR
jgi:drug/metabolite transporter (DMT)-like permease